MSQKRTLLRSQKKVVFVMLRAAGMEPADFDWSQQLANGIRVSRLGYRQGDYYFQFSSYEAGSYCIACPGLYQLVEFNHPKGWAEQADHFHNWSEHLRREIHCLDPWSELARYRIEIEAVCGTDESNETISGAAAQEMARQLSMLAATIEADYELTDEQAAVVRARLAYLAEAAMREKSRDRMYSALGVCATLAMTLSLGENETARLWSLLKRHVGAFVHLSTHESPHAVAGPSE